MKEVIKKTAFSYTPDFPGLRAVNIMEKDFPIEPFLVFTEFQMTRPVFGPHPHAGISVMTTPEQMADARRRNGLGEMGTLQPYEKR